MDTVLTRQEKEKRVLELYTMGKNTREIAQELHMSFRDIGDIIDKAVKQKEAKEGQAQQAYLSSQAYKLFSKGKTPAEVAIELNQRQPLITECYREYWKLKQQYNLNQLYEELNGDIEPFLNLHRLTKASSMNAQHVIRLLAIANNYLPSVEHRYQELKIEEASLQAGNQNSARTFQELSDQISTEQKTLDQYRLSCREQSLEVTKLKMQKIRLEALVNDFQNNNEEYLKMKQTVKKEIESTLADHKQLLELALQSLIESLRKDPRKFHAFYYNMSSSSAKSPSSSSSLSTTGDGSQQQRYDYVPFMNEQQDLSIDYNNEETYEKILLAESQELYDKMVQDFTNKTISDAANDVEPSSLPSLPQLAHSDEQKDNLQRPTSYRYSKEEHTFVESEIDGEDKDAEQ